MSGPVTWTPEMVADLERYWGAGMTSRAIAARLGKTTSAVNAKIRKLRLQGVDLARRDQRGLWDCLYCGIYFRCSHYYNRLCPRCIEVGPFTSAMV